MPSISIETRKLIVQKWCTEKISYKKIAKSVNCSISGVRKVILKFGDNFTIDNLPKSRRRSGPANPQKEAKVVQLLSKNKSMSVRKVAKKAGVSVGTVQNVKKRNNLKTYKKQKAPKKKKRNWKEPKNDPDDCTIFW